MARTRTHPAISVLEIDGIAAGIAAADAMVKRAPIAVLKAGTVHPGHYLILVAGSVAAVEEAHEAGLARAGSWLLDNVLLPDVHPQVTAATLGGRQSLSAEALAVVECRSVPSLLRAADAAIKATEISIARIRLADGLGGRAFLLLDGLLADVEAACEIGRELIPQQFLLQTTVIPRLDTTLKSLLNEGTHFAACADFQPEGAEIDAPR
ncbi:MAG: BMC domain-containing protein [Acidobacteriota bacterium]